MGGERKERGEGRESRREGGEKKGRTERGRGGEKEHRQSSHFLLLLYDNCFLFGQFLA